MHRRIGHDRAVHRREGLVDPDSTIQALLPNGSAAVLVVAGLPGAGKTTLVAGDPRAIDSDDVRLALAAKLRRLPYSTWRPLVHAVHWMLIWQALSKPGGVIVVRPFTSRWSRKLVLHRASRQGREVHLLVVDASAQLARDGQRARGRQLGERMMQRHERRWQIANLDAERWTSVTRLARTR